MHTILQFMNQSGNNDGQIYILQNHPNFKERRLSDNRELSSESVEFPLNDRYGDLVLFDRRKPVSLYDSSVASSQ